MLFAVIVGPTEEPVLPGKLSLHTKFNTSDSVFFTVPFFFHIFLASFSPTGLCSLFVCLVNGIVVSLFPLLLIFFR